jgi:DNA adenine methylase
MTAGARPFFRWVGGKRRLIPQILQLLPASFGACHEPFLGGGALFLQIAASGRLRSGAQLADLNPDLVNAFCCVRDCPETVIARLTWHLNRHSRDHYLAVRNLDRDPVFASLPPEDRTARFIYLTNASFNGGWRVGPDGLVTSSPSTGRLPRIVDDAAIRRASSLLQGVEIACRDFRASLTDDRVQPNDLVFLDPPHLPNGARHDPARYTARRYSLDDQRALDDLVYHHASRHVQIVLSVAWDDTLAERFPGFTIVRIDRPRVAAEALVTSR